MATDEKVPPRGSRVKQPIGEGLSGIKQPIGAGLPGVKRRWDQSTFSAQVERAAERSGISVPRRIRNPDLDAALTGKTRDMREPAGSFTPEQLRQAVIVAGALRREAQGGARKPKPARAALKWHQHLQAILRADPNVSAREALELLGNRDKAYDVSTDGEALLLPGNKRVSLRRIANLLSAMRR